MTSCFECDTDSKKMLNCKRIDEFEYCIECYTELYYYLPVQNKVLQSD